MSDAKLLVFSVEDIGRRHFRPLTDGNFPIIYFDAELLVLSVKDVGGRHFQPCIDGKFPIIYLD